MASRGMRDNILPPVIKFQFRFTAGEITAHKVNPFPGKHKNGNNGGHLQNSFLSDTPSDIFIPATPNQISMIFYFKDPFLPCSRGTNYHDGYRYIMHSF